MIFQDIAHVETELRKLHALAMDRNGDDSALDRMWPLLHLAGNPHEKVKVVHVAGTSGKTSTCYFLAAMLHAAGNNVGLTVSPHVDSITERIQVNGSPISEEAFCQSLGEFMEFVQKLELTPSYFELMISYMYWYFARLGVDYIVVETGMGGMYDATNVVRRPDKVCVITDIGLDHTNVFGNDIKKIALQKAGIIHPGNNAFMHEQMKEVLDVVHERAKTQNAHLTVVPLAEDSRSEHELPLFQERNWHLAKSVYDYVAQRDGLSTTVSIDPSAVLVPGRMESRKLLDGSTLIFDGAHNGQKMTAFVESFRSRYPDKKAAVLLSLKEGKDTKEVLEQLLPITSELIVTNFRDAQDFPISSQDSDEVANAATEIGFEVRVIEDARDAYAELVESTAAELKIVTGSIYLVALLRKAQL